MAANHMKWWTKTKNGEHSRIFLGTSLSDVRLLKADSVFYEDAYDAVSDLMHNWVAQSPDFKSAVRVVKMILNTQCYQYLWLAIWFHAKKSEETLQKSKSLILQCKFGSRAQKWPKNAKKNGSLNRDLLNFLSVSSNFFCMKSHCKP